MLRDAIVARQVNYHHGALGEARGRHRIVIHHRFHEHQHPGRAVVECQASFEQLATPTLDQHDETPWRRRTSPTRSVGATNSIMIRDRSTWLHRRRRTGPESTLT